MKKIMSLIISLILTNNLLCMGEDLLRPSEILQVFLYRIGWPQLSECLEDEQLHFHLEVCDLVLNFVETQLQEYGERNYNLLTLRDQEIFNECRDRIETKRNQLKVLQLNDEQRKEILRQRKNFPWQQPTVIFEGIY